MTKYSRWAVLSLISLLIVCMAIATIIERVEGKTFVQDTIYGSWWFITLWALLTVAGLALLLKAKVHRRLAVFLLHVSFVVILAGALVTHLTAESGTVHLRIDDAVSAFTDDDGHNQPLPFSLRLTDFDIVCYPGTDAVMDYRSTITVGSVVGGSALLEESGGTAMTISMNNIGKTGGYRFYQSSYDSDGKGTVLLVAHDPYGIAITYVGYVMLFLCLLWTLFSRHTRIRQLYRTAVKPCRPTRSDAGVGRNAITSKPLVALLLLCLSVPAANASVITPVSEDVAHDFGKVVVNWGGRLCPVNTAATEFVTKLCGKPSWNGYSADEIFMGWMIYYTEWERQPIIKVKGAEVQKVLGITGRWASVRDFYTKENTYKLRDMLTDTRLPEATRKAVREADEKIQVVTMFYNSEMLRIFPLATQTGRVGEGQLSWHTPGSTDLPLGTPEAEFQFVNHAMDHLVKHILVNDIAGAKEVIAKIKLYQREKAGSVMPSAAMVSTEVWYNTMLSARWVVFLFLTLSIVLCIVLLSGRWHAFSHRAGTIMVVALLAYLTVMLALRWIISGHIPMSNGYETMLFMSWITVVITIATMRRIEVMMAFGPLVSSFCLLVSILAVGSPQITQLMPVLQSPLLSLHVAMVMVAYALLAIITLIGIRGLLLVRQGDVAELARITALSQLLLYPAVTMLSLGIFIGAVWANVSWGTYWSWDPKETWALITLMIYAVPLHRSFMPNHVSQGQSMSGCSRGEVSPVFYHTYIVLAFLTVLMTYFGVNYFLTGMHSYA